MNYQNFIKEKLAHVPPSGINEKCRVKELFPHQRALVDWSLRRGRSANFSGTGLGKMRMELAFADAVNHYAKHDVLMLCPLAVASQIVEEGQKIGVEVNHVHEDGEVKSGISITNYDRLHKFDADRFGCVILDESGIIKHHQSKTLDLLIDSFKTTPFKLCATATPSPNDFTELGTHAEFLGIRSRSEMLAEFFVHDGGETQKWRLKGHARDDFWKWVSSWAAMVRNPADLGFDGSMYQLPPLNVYQHTISTEMEHGELCAVEAQTLMERKQARKKSLFVRAQDCAELVNNSDEIWLIWCELNAEADELKRLIPDAVEVRGSDKEEIKESRLLDFAHGKTRVLISKSKIAGWGLNFQVCNNMAFVGVTDSFESYYQSVRRCYRFGQTKEVNVHVFSADTEGAVMQNLQRKQIDAEKMADELTSIVAESVKNEVLGSSKESNLYVPNQKLIMPNFTRGI
jgi:superfamily II DNA or RNA helicase